MQPAKSATSIFGQRVNYKNILLRVTHRKEYMPRGHTDNQFLKEIGAKGRANYVPKLNDKQKADIRTQKLSVAQYADKYNVSKSLIRNVLKDA